jgi:hypothetical protein
MGLYRKRSITSMGVTSMMHEEAVASSLISSEKIFSICRFVKIIVMTFKIKAAEQEDCCKSP